MLHHPPRATRRTAVGAAVAVVVTTSSCSSTPSTSPGSGPGSGSPTNGVGNTPTSDDTDQDVVDLVVTSLAATAGLVERTRQVHPGLDAELTPLRLLHLAHLEALNGTPGGRAATPPPDPAVARARVLETEERLQRRLTRAALEVDSGALAGLLASMAAAVAQHRTVAAAIPARGRS